MSPVDTPSRSATSAMRVEPKPRSITTWQVTPRISFRRSSTLGLRTAPEATALGEAGPARHLARCVDDAQLDEIGRLRQGARPGPLVADGAHRPDVDHLAVIVDAHEAVARTAEAVLDVHQDPGVLASG